eukprot:TRINITY_DN12827_c0_g1_i4.p1 TRINITY_DN12827_c0_g1~~TRINITY_DN12827_c0_g1_i4.p1  ORF type:complete len:276 (-),score=53.02 TRINITY_DN12827_c0_g1_i4:281-1108(-)
MNIAYNLALAIVDVLENNFTKPNLKLSNILFMENWSVKLADQSYAGFKQGVGEEQVQVDEWDLVYEFGIILWELITEKSGEFFRKEGRFPFFPQGCPTKLRDMILVCCAKDTQSRPSFLQLISEDTFEAIFLQAAYMSSGLCSNMWTTLAMRRPSVSWNEFLPTFCETLKINYPMVTKLEETLEFTCLRALIVLTQQGRNNDRVGCGTVTRESFDRLIKCIGPFIDGSEVLDQVLALLKAPWFSGVMSAPEAKKSWNTWMLNLTLLDLVLVVVMQ